MFVNNVKTDFGAPILFINSIFLIFDSCFI
jgi:hypothetical protein